MHNISRFILLFRQHVELPDGLNVVTEEFQDGWSVVCSGDSMSMDKSLQSLGWNFTWIGQGKSKTCFGKTSQDATRTALQLALRKISDEFNAVEVVQIDLTKLLWFYRARVRVSPYKIQPDSALSAIDTLVYCPSPQRRLPLQTMQSSQQARRSKTLLKQTFLSPARSKEGL